MRIKALLFGLTVLCNGIMMAQNPAILELQSTTQGFLPPVMTEVQMLAIGTPVEGLLVYCTDCEKKGPHIFNGSQWIGNFYRLAHFSDNIGTGGQDPAILELQSTTQGFLPPVMTTTQMMAIAPPTAGLMVYCTDCENNGLQISCGTSWSGLASDDSPILTEIAELEAMVITLQNEIDNFMLLPCASIPGLNPDCSCAPCKKKL